ncbi:MAG: metallophosphoesterase [Verrucomicrobiales bacterium]|nr:metallophosphoesterase [Verrucomicrobiales bacterium]
MMLCEGHPVWRRVRRRSFRSLAGLGAGLGLLVFPGQAGESALGRWLFWPDYRLPERAAHYPGPRSPYPQTPFEAIDRMSPPLWFFGQQPTERVVRLLPSDRVPTQGFSVELWVVDHVDQPVGALATLRDARGAASPGWVLGYFDRQALFALETSQGGRSVRLQADSPRGWLKYWRHIVGTYDGQVARLYINGELQAESDRARGPLRVSETADIEVAAYLAREPYMALGNLLREVQVSDEVLSPAAIRQRFETLGRQVELGIIDADQFHFTAGPALSGVTGTSIGIVWETDRPARAVVRYGRQLPCENERAFQEPAALHEVTLADLEPATSYFYEITARDAAGAEIRSGPLTFQTAVEAASPFGFVVIGDTEARPHINDVLAKAIWAERPHFLLHVGDMTDGGQQAHKWEWNLEYFLGMNQLIGRVPVFPVPGNGESDLHWFTRFHVLPAPENTYAFTYGNAEFFMLDSNRPLGPGSEQYRWLEARLAASKAVWKFAAHHHPTYSSDEDDYGDTWRGPSDLGDLKVRAVVPLYEKYGVDMVFFGHLHTYERTWPLAQGRVDAQRGVRYVQTGGAGGNLEDAAPTRTWFAAKHHRGHHYVLITLQGDRLSFRMFDLQGNLRDAFELEKARSAGAAGNAR